jgi:hypothetical protein
MAFDLYSISDWLYKNVYQNISNGFSYLKTHKIVTFNLIGFITYVVLFYYFLFKKKNIFFDKYNQYAQFVGLIISIVWFYGIIYKIYLPNTSIENTSFQIGKNILIMAFSLVLLFGLIYLLSSSYHFTNFISIFINIILILGVLYLIFKQINNTKIVRKLKQNKFFELFYHYFFLLPCLLFDWTTNIYDDFSNTPTFVFKIFFVLVALIAVYILYPIIAYKLYTHNSSLLLDKPVYTDQERIIGTFENLQYGKLNMGVSSSASIGNTIYPNYNNTNVPINKVLKIGKYGLGIGYSDGASSSSSGNNKNIPSQYKTASSVSPYRYYYSLSSWIFIDNQGQNRNEKSSKYTNLLSYGDKPKIQYKSSSNTLQIIMKKDHNNIEVIYETEKLPLQRWNNIVINYDHGNCDIFINNELVASKKGIVSYMSLDSVVVGEDEGVAGGICNVMYYPYVLSREKLGWFYNLFKNKTPPVLIK